MGSIFQHVEEEEEEWIIVSTLIYSTSFCDEQAAVAATSPTSHNQTAFLHEAEIHVVAELVANRSPNLCVPTFGCMRS